MAPRRRVAGRYPNRLITPGLEKSLPAMLSQVGGQVRTGADALNQLRNQAMRGQLATGLPRDTYPYEFGPNIPLLPAPLDPTGSSGRAEPRLWEYPVSWNLPGQDLRIVPWRILREAGNHPLIRAAITVRKQEVAGMEWDFTISRRAVDEALRDDPSASRLDIESTLREQLRPAIQAAREAWRVPDKGNGLTFAEWTSQVLEEHLVLDALPIYPRKTLGGQWFSFEVVDGATIKPLLDHRGGRPLPPQPAYQQIIYGFPRGEFTADASDTDGQIVIPDAYTADQMIYIRREQRVASPYGLSPVERCLLDLSLWMKRQDWLRDEYDEATRPAGWLTIDSNSPTADWNPSQVLEYETALNDYFSANQSARQRHRMLPPGVMPIETGSDVAEKFKPEFDLHLMKLVLMHFDVTTHELGFPEHKGLGGAGHAEGQDRINERRGRLPTLRWLASVFTSISRVHLGLPPELEFNWVDLEDEPGAGGQGEQPTVIDLVTSGLKTVNEARDEVGLPRFTFPEADRPFILSPKMGGMTFLDMADDQAQAAIEGVRAQSEQARHPSDGAQSGKPAAGKPKPAADDPAKKAEAKAYRAWARRESARPFALKAIGVADLDTFGIDPERVTFGGDDLGKAQWPGWGPDLDIAAGLTAKLRSAALGSVDVAAIAAAWIAYVQGQQAVDGQDPGTTPGIQHPVADAVLAGSAAWLTGRVLASLVRAFTGPLSAALSSAWSLGEQSARQVVGDHDHEPTPDPSAGEVTDIAERAAQRYLDQAARQLDEHRADTDPTVLTQALTDVLDDESTASNIAETEVSRRISTAAETNYAAFGIAGKRWIIAPGQRVCVRCARNAEEGPIPVGQDFTSGDPNPPAHPRCRCAVIPVFEL